jgi:hypothetical protein
MPSHQLSACKTFPLHQKAECRLDHKMEPWCLGRPILGSRAVFEDLGMYACGGYWVRGHVLPATVDATWSSASSGSIKVVYTSVTDYEGPNQPSSWLIHCADQLRELACGLRATFCSHSAVLLFRAARQACIETALVTLKVDLFGVRTATMHVGCTPSKASTTAVASCRQLQLFVDWAQL